jgi:hypothetical protein
MIVPRLPWSLLLLATAACSARAPEFPTIVRPPEQVVPKALPEEPTGRTIDVGRELGSAERVVRRFFLALKTGDQEALRHLLSTSPKLMSSGSESGRTLASADLARFTSSNDSNSNTTQNGPASLQILGLTEQADATVTAWVAVAGAEPTRGTWTLRLSGEGDKLVIFELVVPE